MVIAVNTRLIVKNKFCGISWFAYESLKRVAQSHPEHKFLFLFDRPFSKEYIFAENITPVVIGPPTRHPFLWYLWVKFSLPKVLQKYKPDLFLSPDGFLPLKYKGKTVNVIHDVGFEHLNENLPLLARMFYKKYFPLFAKQATRIATVSQFCKDDIISTYNIPSEKIDVIYDGVNESFKPISEEQKNVVREKHTSGNEYFIAIGRLHLRKNTQRLLQAFDAFKASTASSLKLVIVGNIKWQSQEVKDVYDKMKFREDVIFAGRIEIDVLKNLMGAALALVFVPHYEGFGLALLEAMNCDVPVISVDTTSLPELAGDAALYVNALSVDSIKDGMIRIYEDGHLRSDLIEKGRKQRILFSWNKTAINLWRTINIAMNGQNESEEIIEEELYDGVSS